MRFNTLKYYLSSAIESLFKNSLMTVASIFTLSSCIFIFIVTFILGSNVDYMLEKVEASIGFSVFLNKQLTQEDVHKILKEIKTLPHVTEVEYISKEKGLKKMEELFNDQEGILEGLAEDNPLSDSFDVYLDSIQNQTAVLEQVKALNQSLRDVITLPKQEGELPSEDVHSDDLLYIKSFDTNVLVRVNHIVRIISVVLILLMAVISIALIVNTIKLTVNSRKREINIMKYVGATDWFIRWPFVIEGIIIGGIGSVVPLLVSIIGYSNLMRMLKDNVLVTSKPILEIFLQGRTTFEIFSFIAPTAVLMGILIGVIGSVSSMRKYLKV